MYIYVLFDCATAASSWLPRCNRLSRHEPVCKSDCVQELAPCRLAPSSMHAATRIRAARSFHNDHERLPGGVLYEENGNRKVSKFRTLCVCGMAFVAISGDGTSLSTSRRSLQKSSVHTLIRYPNQATITAPASALILTDFARNYYLYNRYHLSLSLQLVEWTLLVCSAAGLQAVDDMCVRAVQCSLVIKLTMVPNDDTLIIAIVIIERLSSVIRGHRFFHPNELIMTRNVDVNVRRRAGAKSSPKIDHTPALYLLGRRERVQCGAQNAARSDDGASSCTQSNQSNHLRRRFAILNDRLRSITTQPDVT